MSDADHRMALAEEWDSLVAQARELPGFDGFLRPPPASSLSAAADGPVVVVTVTRWACAALIARGGRVTRLELPELTADSVADVVRRYLAAIGAHDARDATATFGELLEPELAECLAVLWDGLAEPILDHLGFGATPEDPWPRLWWCPTGPLAFLPLHAAGRHGTPGAAVVDRVISSYTPTLRALRQARQARPTAGSMLVVGLPETPGLPELPSVEAESELLARLLPGRVTALTGREATRARVLAELPAAAWAHFACHGRQDPRDPSSGALLLHDGPLSVTDLAALRHTGDLAYLSGCKTAVGGADLPDEAITLAAALQYTGFRHVIATLWTVGDAYAARVAADVYAELAVDGRIDADRAAGALHRAVRRLRERAMLSAWTPFVHLGP